MKIPSDRKILNTIYKLYYKEFETFTTGAENGRATKVYLPIDCKKIAKKLNVDDDIVFGRLYYHLEEKYGYRRDDGSRVAFFSLKVGPDDKCVNFPLLVSVLAGLQEESSKSQRATLLSTLAIAISIVVPVVKWLSK
ncbi:hypothetical protein [Pseudomonas sp. FP1742]|uniref:hypothetical protein n=1 Tax=Pseudomonas sp. FP1742 TaxID=2954079 RepID=UPI0027336746|nr:hypothetical protein [Pseudomonas sp. FP1742]WLG52247.1 hypothetical protein PSH64_06935 [Pseudomonas sp. FP1742]